MPTIVGPEGRKLKIEVPRLLVNAILGLFLTGFNKKSEAEFDP